MANKRGRMDKCEHTGVVNCHGISFLGELFAVTRIDGLVDSDTQKGLARVKRSSPARQHGSLVD